MVLWSRLVRTQWQELRALKNKKPPLQGLWSQNWFHFPCGFAIFLLYISTWLFLMRYSIEKEQIEQKLSCDVKGQSSNSILWSPICLGGWSLSGPHGSQEQRSFKSSKLPVTLVTTSQGLFLRVTRSRQNCHYLIKEIDDAFRVQHPWETRKLTQASLNSYKRRLRRARESQRKSSHSAYTTGHIYSSSFSAGWESIVFKSTAPRSSPPAISPSPAMELCGNHLPPRVQVFINL